MAKTVKQLVDEANAEIETITAEQAIEEMTNLDVVMVDLRDIRELQREGMVENAFHMPRGMVEFWIDSESPYHKPIFSSNKRFIFYCSLGWRSALAARAARQVGLENHCHVEGGFKALQQANVPVASVTKKTGRKALGLEDISDLLPYIVQPENVARYEQGAVLIGDRSRYPFTKKPYQCNSVEEVAKAIEGMITQGSGPWMAASYALVLAAEEVEGKAADQISEHMQEAKQRLVATRPTNTALATRLDLVDVVIETALQTEQPLTQKVLEWVQGMVARVYADYSKRAGVLADLIEDGDGILTNCFAETSFILGIAMASGQGKDIHVYTPETRPYLQGARLTAPSIHELGVKVTLVTDNMPAHLMSLGKIQKYVTAADLITLDGHVVNKVGTFQSAVAAQYHGIPYFPIAWGLDEKSRTKEDINVEVRDAEEIRRCLGQTTTLDSIDAYYPAFDITPPELVAGVISTQGVLSPYNLKGASL